MLTAYRLDATGIAVPLGMIDDFQSMRFTRSYSGIGTWEMSISVYSACMARIRDMDILRIGHKRSGLVTSVRADGQADGSCQVTFSGVELKGMAARRIVCPPETESHLTVNAQVEAVMAELIRSQLTEAIGARQIPGIIAAYETGGPKITYSGRYSPLQDDITTLAEQYEIGWYADIENRGIAWHIYAGVDRRVGAPNNTLLLSYERGTINTSSYSYTAQAATTAITAGQGEGVDRSIYVAGNQAKGLHRIEIYVDARDIDDAAMLPARGEQYLSQQGSETTYSLQGSHQLLKGYLHGDWDVGDRCTIRDQRLLNGDLDSRVTEVTETYEQGRMLLDLCIGYDKQKLEDVLRRNNSRTQALINKEG